MKKHGFPNDKVLAAGIIDGRNIWSADLEQKSATLTELLGIVSKDRLIIQPSASLLHVPITVQNENMIEPILKDALSFADEKLAEVVLLTKGLNDGFETIQNEVAANSNAIQLLNESPFRNNERVKKEIANLDRYQTQRQSVFKVRQKVQKEAFQLPLLPTTTIGSFPQTKEVRKQRLDWRKGELTDATISGICES